MIVSLLFGLDTKVDGLAKREKKGVRLLMYNGSGRLFWVVRYNI